MIRRTVSEILTSSVIGVSPETRISEAVSIMKDKRISCIVVMEEGRLKGLFTERDVVRAAKQGHINGIPIKELMTEAVITAKEDMSVYEAYNIFDEHRIRHLVVEDNSGNVSGILTQSDIINNIGLEFFVSLKNVSDIMTSSVMSLKRKDDSFGDAIAVMADRSISCIVIEEDKRPIGILTERDITRLVMEKTDHQTRIGNIMSAPVFAVSVNMPVYEAAKMMKENNIRRLVAVDDKGAIAGLITQSDIVKGLKGKYTEFLKEIINEQEKMIREAGESLMESERKYRSMVSNAPVGIYRSNIADGKILFANNALAGIFEFGSPQEMMNSNALSRYKNPTDREKLIALIKEQGKIDGMELEMLTNTGKPIHVFINSVIEGDTLTGMVVDITKRKLDEKMLREKNLELSALCTVASEISKTMDMDKLFEDILRAITDLDVLNVKRLGGIFIVEGESLRLVHHLGHPDEFLELHKDFRVGQCLCGLAAQTGEIIVSANSHKDRRHTVCYHGMSPHGHIIVPLKAKDKVVGILYLYLPADTELDKSVIDMLDAVGNQIGIAVENSKLYEETKALSLRDALTGLANRRLMEIVLERLMAEVRRHEKALSVIMLDIDYFKKYNDTNGHPAGDRLLSDIARLITNETRAADLAVRYGGEEFLILLPDSGLEESAEVGERIRKSVEANTNVTVSLGVSSYREGIQGMEELIRRADEALYRAKQSGRNRVESDSI
jgi:diguanylate cyclase (GGDEF)-like protein/PAS domain S-box-containing protein